MGHDTITVTQIDFAQASDEKLPKTAQTQDQIFVARDREKIVSILKTLMYFERYSILLDISSDDKTNAKFINEVWKEWPNFKKTIESYAKTLKNKWKEEEKKDTTEHYFG